MLFNMAHRIVSLFGNLRCKNTIAFMIRSSSSGVGETNIPSTFVHSNALNSKIVEARDKDMPVSDMPNPYEREKAKCILCHYKITANWKNVKLLSQFVSPYTGRIYGSHITGLCRMQQKKVEEEITKSQNAGLMAYYLKEVEYLNDPKLFNPDKPIRPHRF